MNLRYPESIRPLTSLCGWVVKDATGAPIARLRDAMVFVGRGQIACAVVAYGGADGRPSRTVALPWAALVFDVADRSAVLADGFDALEGAPAVAVEQPMDVSDIDGHPLIYMCHRLAPASHPGAAAPRFDRADVIADHRGVSADSSAR